MEYKNVTQKVSLAIESILQKSKQVQHADVSWHVRFENYSPRKLRQ
jgi:hypothetical protein